MVCLNVKRESIVSKQEQCHYAILMIHFINPIGICQDLESDNTVTGNAKAQKYFQYFHQ